MVEKTVVSMLTKFEAYDLFIYANESQRGAKMAHLVL